MYTELNKEDLLKMRSDLEDAYDFDDFDKMFELFIALDETIILEYEYRPMPCRDMDYIAYRDGFEEGSMYGGASNKEQAIVRLMEIEYVNEVI